jgi:hypothetical protein
MEDSKEVQKKLSKAKEKYSQIIEQNYQQYVKQSKIKRWPPRYQSAEKEKEKYEQFKRCGTNYINELIHGLLLAQEKESQKTEEEEEEDKDIHVELDILKSKFDFIFYYKALQYSSLRTTIKMPCCQCNYLNSINHNIVFVFHRNQQNQEQHENRMNIYYEFYLKTFELKRLWHLDTKRILTFPSAKIYYWISLLPEEVVEEMVQILYRNVSAQNIAALE